MKSWSLNHLLVLELSLQVYDREVIDKSDIAVQVGNNHSDVVVA